MFVVIPAKAGIPASNTERKGRKDGAKDAKNIHERELCALCGFFASFAFLSSGFPPSRE
jgi:hypothetical protein